MGFNIMRTAGVGDIIFMQPAVAQLKASGTKVTLHTLEHLMPVGRLIGCEVTLAGRLADARGGLTTSDVRRILSSAVKDVSYALERHPARYIVDRVTLWEVILGLQTTETPVRFTLPEGGRERIAMHPEHDPGKPNVLFAPKGAHAPRSWQPHLIYSVLTKLVEVYNVVIPTGGPTPTDLEFPGALLFPGTPMEEFFAIVRGCDVVLSHDTGAAWVGAGGGVPTVVTFDQVEPWLRMRRFENCRAVWMRLPECMCDHHGHCTNGDRVCNDGITGEEIIGHIEAARAGQYGMWRARTGEAVRAPVIEVPRNLAVLDSEALGMNIRVVDAPTGTADFVLHMTRREKITREQLWGLVSSVVHPQGGRMEKQARSLRRLGVTLKRQ